MEAIVKKNPEIRVSHDNMKAYLYLPGSMMDDYTVTDVHEALKRSGVSYGILEGAIQDAIDARMMGREVLVAQGNMPQDGVDGYYEYKFSKDFSKKPKASPDGSVDYWSIKMLETVTEGQEIAVYHPAVQGTDGMNVKGGMVLAKRGRDLPPLKGKGFNRSADGLSYTSQMDGKIEMRSDRITISSVYEVQGDVDLSIGNIDFRGDVVVHGGVCSGATVKATGTITIDGIVEGARIEAGRDNVLRSGVMGASRASISTRGNIYAKFFEYTRVHANGFIQADVFLNCQVSCGENIILEGKKASIIGGEVGAIQGIVANTLGSDGQVRTKVKIGNGSAVMRRVGILKSKIQVEKANLEKIERGLKVLKDMKNDPRRTELLRVKIRDAALLAEDTAELEKLEDQLERARGGSVKVIGRVYPGVCVEIDELKLQIQEVRKGLEFTRDMDRIVMCSV